MAKFIATQENVYISYENEAPEAGPLVMAISIEQKDHERLGKPRLYPDTSRPGKSKIKISNGGFYAFLTFDQIKELDIIDDKYIVLNPIIVPTAKSLANKSKTKLTEEF